MAEAKSRLVIEISSENAKRNADALDSALKNVDKSGDTASKSVKSFGDTANKSTQSVDVLATSAKKLAVIMGGYLSISEAINKSDAYTNLQNRLKLVTKSQMELSQAMSDTFKIAQSTRQSWESAAQVYQGFANNAKTLGLNMQQTARLTETVSKAVAISGATTASAEAALVQFNQALSAGALRGEELNSVMEQTPALAKAIAQGMGITVGQLRTVAATGSITSEALVKALDKAKGSVDSLFAKTDSTIGQSFTILNNEVTKFVGEAGKANGSAKALADGIQLIANNFGTFASLGIATLMGLITTQIVKQTISMAGSIVAWNTETRAVLANNAAKMTSLTIGRSLLGIIGGPVGLGVTVAATAAAYLLMRDSTDRSTQALIENSKYARQSTEDLLKLQGAQKRGAVEDLSSTYADLAKKMKELSSQYNAQVIDIQNSNKANWQVVDISNKVRQGVISKAEAFKQLNKIQTVTPEQISRLGELYDSYVDTSKALLDVKGKLDSVGSGMDKTSESTQKAAASQEMYNQKIRDMQKLSATSMLKTQYQLNNEILNGGTERGQDWNKFIEKFRTENKIDFTKTLTTEQYNIAQKQFELEQKLKNQQEDNTKAIKEQTKEKERQISLELSSNKELARGYQIYQAYLKAGLSKNQALSMASQVGRENGFNDNYLFGSHSDANNGKTNVGMFSYQGSRATSLLKDLRSKDLLNNDGSIKRTDAAIQAQVEYSLNEIMKDPSFQKTKNALLGGTQNRDELSKVVGKNYIRWDYDGKKIDAASHKAREANYYDRLSGLVNKSNDSSSINISDFGADEEKLYQLKIQLDEKFYTKEKKAQQDHEKELRDIRLTYTGSEQAEKLKQSEDQFQAQTQLSKMQFDQQVNGWSWVGEQRIAKDADVKKAIIDASTELTEQQKLISKRSIDEQAAYEIETFRKTQSLKVQDLQTKINQQLGKAQSESIEAQAKVRGVMSPNALATWQLQNQYGGELSTAFDDHDSNVRKINEQDKNSRKYEIADAQERHKLLLQADEAYEAQKFAISQKYANQAEELKVTQTQSQLQLYSQLTSQASEVWGSMTDMVKQARGENSKEYKTMFLMQKAMAIGQQIINTELAAGATTAQTGIFGIPAATAIRAMGYASVGLIAAQTIAGFSSGGYTGDGSVFEPAGVVHKGEVVFSQADVSRLGGVGAVEGIRKGIKGYSEGGVVGGSASIASQLNNSSQQQGNVNIEVNVTDSGTSTSGTNTDNQKQLGQMIGNTVRTIIRQEQRQGGLLSK